MQQSVQLAWGPTISSINLALMHVALIAVLCCACPIWSLVVVVVSCMLLLHPVPTSNDVGPDLCNLCFVLVVFPFFQLVQPFHLHGWWLSPVATWNWWCFFLQIAHLHTWWVTLCNLHWWCFFINPPVQLLYLLSGNLHCVVVVSIYI